MRAIRILLRHRVTNWIRDPSWGDGTVAGQIVLMGLLLFLLAPLGLASYVVGDVLREVVPGRNPIMLLNGGMLYFVPVLMGSRFLLQSPPSERIASYTTLPVSPGGLLNGQVILSLLSIHSLAAIVLVGPVWAAEIMTAWAPLPAFAWLGTALLLTVGVANHGALLLHLLLGRRPWLVLGALGIGGVGAAVDVALGGESIQAVSRAVFGRPGIGLAGAVVGMGGLHAAVLQVMQERLEIDGRSSQRVGVPSGRGPAVYRWIERTLPAGRLVALELRQVVRTRRMRGMAITGLGLSFLFYGIVCASLVWGGTIDGNGVMNLAFWGIGSPFLMVGFTVYGLSAGYLAGLLARPHALSKIAAGKLALLWASLLPGSVLIPVLMPWMQIDKGIFLVGCALYWWGAIVPSTVYYGPRFRTPIDTSASAFTVNASGTLRGLVLLPVILGLLFGWFVAFATGAWAITAAVMGLVGLGGLGLVAWTWQPFARQLERHRREMLEAFRETEPM